MYNFYLGKTLLPVAPSKLQLKINNANKTYTLINDGEINVLKTPELTDIDFEILLPNTKDSYGKYKNGFKKPYWYLKKLKKYKQKKKTFKFIVTRSAPNGKNKRYSTNMKVSLEDYTVIEDADNGLDTVVSIRLKQYRKYGTKKCKITFAGTKPTISSQNTREAGDTMPQATSYTVVSGDSLWKIAATHLGSGSRWNEIYNLNKSVIGGNPNLIYPGQVFTLPS